MNKVVRRPWPGELHLALLHLLNRRAVLVLITLYRLVIDQVSDIQQHLARFHPLAGDLLGQRKKHAVHLYRQCPRLGLALTLAARALAQARKVLLTHRRVISHRHAGADIVDQHLQVHLSLAPQTFNIGKEVTLIGADGTPQRIVVLEGRTKPERKYSRMLEAVRDHARMILLRLLVHSDSVIGMIMLGNYDGKLTCGK